MSRLVEAAKAVSKIEKEMGVFFESVDGIDITEVQENVVSSTGRVVPEGQYHIVEATLLIPIKD